MTLTYHDVLTTDLTPLLNAAEKWQRMGKRFGTLQVEYRDNVQGALHSGGWAGFAFDTQQMAARNTAFEYGAAQTEANAIASILHAAYQELVERQQALRHLVDDAKENGFTVDGEGVVRYAGYDDLTPADRHDPDYQKLMLRQGEAADQRTIDIRKAVQDCDESDQGVKLALKNAATDTSPDGSGVGGFNANASNPVGAPVPDQADGTHTDGWHGSGSITSSTTPDFSITGSLTPKAGKEMSFKEVLTVASISGEGTLTNGPVELTGNFKVDEEARVFANFGFTNQGLKAQLEASAGLRASAEGHANLGQDAGVYGRASGFAGAEVSDNLKVGLDGASLGAKAFVGEKASGAAGVEVGGVGAGFTADGNVGLGAEAKFNFGPDPDSGKWKIGADVGLTPGIGGDLGFEFTFDPKKFTHAVGDVTSAGSHAAHALGNAAKSTGHALKNVASLGGLL